MNWQTLGWIGWIDWFGWTGWFVGLVGLVGLVELVGLVWWVELVELIELVEFSHTCKTCSHWHGYRFGLTKIAPKMCILWQIKSMTQGIITAKNELLNEEFSKSAFVAS